MEVQDDFLTNVLSCRLETFTALGLGQQGIKSCFQAAGLASLSREALSLWPWT